MPLTTYTSPEDHAKAKLTPESQLSLNQGERLTLYKDFLSAEEQRITLQHQEGAGGIEIATMRSQLMDIVLQSMFDCAKARLGAEPKLALVADGGYGRGTLNPGSDIDLLFLLPFASNKLTPELKTFVEEILYLLWDLNFKVGHASRSVGECMAEAKRDPLNRTSLLDARLVAGDTALFQKLESQFFSTCLEKSLDEFLEERRNDIVSRHKKYSGTVFLQEPNVKESPGGLRDYHNLMWILYARRQSRDLITLVEEKTLTRKAYRELTEAYEFLMRVRNDLHYSTDTSSDLLTLRLQGVVADNFGYPQENILRRIEAFMREFYTHVKNLHQHTLSIFEIFQIEIEDNYSRSWARRLLGGGNSAPKEEKFGCYKSRGNRIYPLNRTIFEKEPLQLMQMFLECQKRGLRLSPPMRKLVKASLELVDAEFRSDPDVRSLFREILSAKGKVARSLRQMHRVNFLGTYMPEFGALTCLVQHEFFHRYTADEHTLRCIEQLDKLVNSDDPDTEIYRKLALDLADPYAMNIGMLMHDAGRAENVREHIDGSAILAAQVCDRLKLRGERRRLITFLVDHHLTLFRTATKMDTSDPQVIEEFANQMKEVEYLDAMLVFTYADSMGTNEESWTKWKESLILRLYNNTRHYLLKNEHASEEFLSNKSELKQAVLGLAETGVTADQVESHFELMPNDYFRFRHPRDIALHAGTIHEFKNRASQSADEFECYVSWIDYPKLGYSMMNLAAQDEPYLLERICHGLAGCGLSILSSDIYTRPDGIALDLFRLSTSNGDSVNEKKHAEAEASIRASCTAESASKSELVVKKSIMDDDSGEIGITVPVRAWIDNVGNQDYTVLSIQAVDRIGLLFEILREVRRAGFATSHARICTENGVAMDSIFITTADDKKVEDEEKLTELVATLNAIIKLPDPTLPER